MRGPYISHAVFLTLVRSVREKACARVLIDSIRSFGGALSPCKIWLFEAKPHTVPCNDLEGKDVDVFPLTIPDTVRHYAFADKVYACAWAEEQASGSVQSLIWIDPACLIIQPPVLFALNQSVDAAVRPVHIRNVGLTTTEPVNDFWQKTYEAVGVEDVQVTVESFVEGQQLRAYYNSHAFSVNPSRGLLSRWYKLFEALVADEFFQTSSCRDALHRIFLHQAVLSALLATTIEPARIRVLPPEYNYPYNLHQTVPLERRASTFNDLVCITYEDRFLDPHVVDDICIREPLRSWLSLHVSPDSSPAQEQ
jgi:hypothetical protein